MKYKKKSCVSLVQKHLYMRRVHGPYSSKYTDYFTYFYSVWGGRRFNTLLCSAAYSSTKYDKPITVIIVHIFGVQSLQKFVGTSQVTKGNKNCSKPYCAIHVQQKQVHHMHGQSLTWSCFSGKKIIEQTIGRKVVVKDNTRQPTAWKGEKNTRGNKNTKKGGRRTRPPENKQGIQFQRLQTQTSHCSSQLSVENNNTRWIWSQ